MSKYPAFERVTAGKLQVGDRLLVRERADDRLHAAASLNGTTNDLTVAPGVHEVVRIESELHRWAGAHKASRTYNITLSLGHRPEEHQIVTVAAVNRLNRVTA